MEAKIIHNFELSDPYDDFLYPNYCYPQSHPDRMGSLATLFGMSPAPVERCRVLELACGDGANLLPMAMGLPDSEFLGIDRAVQPIARGNQLIQKLGVENLELQQRDILELSADLGKFDYIIAHGLYSWVPPEIQERILELCRSALNPQGVAYISYNVYPGCHLREITRGMMLFHTREIHNPRERVAQGKALIKWLSEAQTQTNAYSLFLQQINEAFAKKNDGAIYHDDLAEINSPLYFYEFITRAARHGLQFLSEAEYFYTPDHTFQPAVNSQLQRMEQDDVVGKEQYVDFLEARSFRQTLLCHHEVRLDRAARPERAKLFRIKADISPVSTEVDLRSDAIEEFRGPKDCAISTSFPLAKAAMVHLGKVYPHSVRFDELLAQATKLLGTQVEVTPNADSEESKTLAEIILNAYGAGVISLHLHEPSFTVIPGEQPAANPLARLQAQDGPMVTSLLYNSVKLDDPVGQRLLTLLDGTRDRNALLKELAQMLKDEDSDSNSNPIDRQKLMEILSKQLDEKLLQLGRLGFMVQ